MISEEVGRKKEDMFTSVLRLKLCKVKSHLSMNMLMRIHSNVSCKRVFFLFPTVVT